MTRKSKCGLQLPSARLHGAGIRWGRIEPSLPETYRRVRQSLLVLDVIFAYVRSRLGVLLISNWINESACHLPRRTKSLSLAASKSTTIHECWRCDAILSVDINSKYFPLANTITIAGSREGTLFVISHTSLFNFDLLLSSPNLHACHLIAIKVEWQRLGVVSRARARKVDI